MPYTEEQCAKFAIMEKNGEPVPDDWREECAKDSDSDEEKE